MSSFEAIGTAVAPIESVRTGDLAALVRTYAPLLYRVAWSVLRSPSEAEDAVQDCFVRVLEHRAELPAVREMRVWLVRIVWNLALDRRRRIRPGPLEPELLERLTDPQGTPEQHAAASQQTTRVLHALERLPRAEQQALLLSAVDELDTAEVARILNRSESATRALLFRARARLRERLGGRQRKGDR